MFQATTLVAAYIINSSDITLSKPLSFTFLNCDCKTILILITTSNLSSHDYCATIFNLTHVFWTFQVWIYSPKLWISRSAARAWRGHQMGWLTGALPSVSCPANIAWGQVLDGGKIDGVNKIQQATPFFKDWSSTLMFCFTERIVSLVALQKIDFHFFVCVGGLTKLMPWMIFLVIILWFVM